MRARIRQARQRLELTQAQVAKAAGLSRSSYSLFENGHLNLLPATLEKILDALDIDVKRRARLALRRTIAALERKAS